MDLPRRRFAGAAAGLFLAGPVVAQMTDRPIRLVVGFPPGGGLDIVTRVIAQNMTPHLNQTVIVDNKPGGDGIISAEAVAKSAPDGRTLYVGSASAFIATPLLRGGAVSYDPFKDFTPISQLGLFTLIWVAAPSMPVSNLAEFVAYVRARPGQLNYASASSTGRLAAIQLLAQHKLDMKHIPYKGDTPGLTDLMGDRVHLMVTTVATARGFVKEGKMRPLMLQRESRTPVLPDVPTGKEAGAVIRISPWSGLFGPANMPPAVVDRVNQALRAAVSGKEVRDRFEQMGFEPAVTTPQEMAAIHRKEYEVFRTAIQEDGIKFD